MMHVTCHSEHGKYEHVWASESMEVILSNQNELEITDEKIVYFKVVRGIRIDLVTINL